MCTQPYILNPSQLHFLPVLNVSLVTSDVLPCLRPEELLDQPDFLLWSAGQCCRPPCTTHRYRTDSQQSLWLAETQVLLLEPQLRGRPTAVLRLRLAGGRERLTELEAYPLDAFVADVGGHLGLLLGGSVLALLQLADQLGRAARNRIRP